MPKKLFLIDGSNHAFRVFHAMPRNMYAAGFPTGALLGFANMLRKLERDYEPDWIVVCFDNGPSFRIEMYPEYKGHRPNMPDELREQWGHFQSLVEAWGHTFLNPTGVEADDVIGTLAKQLASPEVQVTMVTGDKDFYQLVDDDTEILDVMKDKVIDREGVIERFGVPPDKVIDVQGLAGDSSDNVPGVPGVGVKTAMSYVQKYGDLEGAIAAYEQLSGLFDTYVLSTAPWENHTAWSDKLLWIKKHLGTFAYKRLILTHHKNLNQGDYLVDDRTKNGADRFAGEHIHFGTEKFPDWPAVTEYLCEGIGD